MSRKKIVPNYAISLDIGNASVGWAAFTPDYRLMRAKGRELIGVRLFEPAQTAEARRMARTTRRRYSRRRWRLHMLDAIFDAPLAEVDPSFLARRKYSWVHPADENNADYWYGGVLFDSKNQDKRFYKQYPTIYHLRKTLMEDDKQHDIREVYFAVHHLLKYRGNFLVEGDLDSSSVFDSKNLLNLIGEIILCVFDEQLDGSWTAGIDKKRLADTLCTTKGSRSMRVENALAVICESCELPKEQINVIKAIFAGLEGNKLDLAKIFPSEERTSDEKKALGIYFNKSDYEEVRAQVVDSGLLDDEQCELLDKMQKQYSAIALKQLLGNAKSVSESMCASYTRHQRNWDLIKKELRTEDNADEINKHYGELVGWTMVDGRRRSIRGTSTYEKTRQNANKYFSKLIEASNLSESKKMDLKHAIDEDRLFPVQRDSDNGVIPYQLHRNELRRILEKQGKYYPFLLDTFEKNGEQVNKIEGLLTFRVPYFVGPLVEREGMQPSDNGENHWMKRKKSGEITPWNFDKMVDKDESGRRFIERLVDTDSYLLGEATLPKNSMLYQEYEVLNELNNVRLSVRSGNRWENRRRQRLGREEKTLLIRNLLVKNYGFPEWIDEQNLGADKKQSLESMVDELHVSPKVKRGIIQSVRLIDDISKAVGKKPSRIFLELAGDIQASVRTTSRKNRLLELYKNAGLRKEFSDIYDRLEASDDKGLQDDRWFLYYTQLGKDMYTGEELDIDRLSSDYDIDHIIPQAVTQNDSLDNRVLVSRAANARKTDSFAYLPELVEARRGFWQELLDNRLISQTKFERLVRQNDFGRHEKERFVERSLVETRQIMKNVATLMRRRYGNSSAVIGLNSELTKEMRQYLGFEHKNRDINDYHHAQDALCLGVAGQFAVNRGFFDNGAVSDGAANAYNIYLQDYLRGYREKLKAGDRKHGKAFGFIVGSMASADENKRINPKTGEIAWSEADKDYLRRVMNYRKMLVTQKVGDSFGALYNETRYGAAVKEGHDGIAFDKNKADTSLYGGFSSAKVVYSILVELKGKVRLVNITMQEYSMLGDCPSDEALKKVLVAKKPEYAKAKILLRHIPSMQLIHYKGACMTIKSATELNNARQLWLDCDVYNALDDYLKCGTSKSSIDIMQIWDALFDAVNKHYPLHRVEESTLAKARTKFEKLDLDKQLDVLGMIVVALHADPGRANLSLVGLPSEWKRVRSVSFSDDDEFVFQSPSGLFETKITIAELKKAE